MKGREGWAPKHTDHGWLFIFLETNPLPIRLRLIATDPKFFS